MAIDPRQHADEILCQFTQQVEPFLRRHGRTGEALLELMASCAELQQSDELLDVACGPGIVSCFLATRVRRVTGLDLVPAMLDRARQLQAERGLKNIDWKLGYSSALPFEDETFDRVVTRFSFHHYLEPSKALGEMQRVCRRGGTVLVADVAPRNDAQESFNQWERLRDPSHTRALTAAEFRGLGEGVGLSIHRQANFTLEMDLESLLAGSFPMPGNADRIRSLFREDIQSGRDRLGVAARFEDSAIKLTYPMIVIAWQRRR
jgi:SAM-dependent methyltransferase